MGNREPRVNNENIGIRLYEDLMQAKEDIQELRDSASRDRQYASNREDLFKKVGLRIDYNNKVVYTHDGEDKLQKYVNDNISKTPDAKLTASVVE